MILTLVAAHLAVGCLAPLLARLLGSRAFWLAALLPATAFGWLVSLQPQIASGAGYTESLSWIPALGISLDARIGVVQWVLGLIVTGIGALILFYCRWYFQPSAAATRCLGLMTAFAGVMLGLVTADNLMLLYVHWELTTVFSYLLVGNDYTRRANRSAATTALIVTTVGGLAMLVGLIILGVTAGTLSLAGILQAPPPGLLPALGALLMLVGALSKSALAPFHFWLPGAMAAPTPVSAYLHAAAMVKAGVYLVMVLAPVFATVPGWRPAVCVLGAATMLLGGWRSLRQVDLKLLLAYGTVSQLGFLVLLAGLGTRAGALAALAMTVAHALFKSTLFLTVGIIDHSAGTRDLTKLSGVGRRAPALAVAAGLAAASMAGLPPLLGFISKEAALESLVLLADDGGGIGATPGLAVLLTAAVVTGSALTVAYSLRFVWGAFADRPGVAGAWHDQGQGIRLAPYLLAALCLAGGFLGEPLTRLYEGYAATVPTGTPGYGLALWHGLTLPLGLSAVALASGFWLFWRREAVEALQATFPHFVDADEWYKRSMRLLDGLGVEVTARVQSGSVAAYLSVIVGVVLAGVGGTLLVATAWPERVLWFDNVGQPLVGAVMVTAAVLAAMARGRVRAVLLVGVTGYGAALLFLLHGAPDLALTQMLVESVTLVVFLLLMRHLPKYFTDRPLRSARWLRVLLAGGLGATVTGFAVLTAAARRHEPASTVLQTAAKEFGYGTNIVNVILVDTRAWDTIGEISVLAIAATGVASLIFLRGRVQPLGERALRTPETAPGAAVWLRGSQSLDPASRSLVFEVTTRILFGIMIVASVYLLLAGHNAPGGGFAGGLVAGMALVIRYLAAGRTELNEAAPFDAGKLLGAGLVLSVLSALAPIALGGRIFQSFDAYVRTPLGEMHLVSSTVFDVGVYLVVIGVLLDFVRSLGAGIDLQAAEETAPLPEPESTRTVPGRDWGRTP